MDKDRVGYIMNIVFFNEKTQNHMSFLKSKYCFDETVEENIIKYHNSTIVIFVSMDNFFEISISFSDNINGFIKFIDILEYLNFDEEIVELVKHNQCTEKTIDNFYLNILPYLDKVVYELSKKHWIFEDCLEYVLSNQKLLLQEEEAKNIQKKLNIIWQNQDYNGYVSAFGEYESLVKLDEIFLKRNNFAKKQLAKKTKQDKTG